MSKKLIFFFLFFFAIQAMAKENIFIKFESGVSVLAELVISPEEKALGLSFRKQKNNFAMFFWYNQPQELIFWMKDMNFAIDILWIRNGKIVWFEENVPPPSRLLKTTQLPTYGQGIIADKVLELPAGASKKYNIKKGDKIQWDRKRNKE